ncbi:protein TESPA1 [Poecile atricapillus]|uniref:protein TESPA1 n=1 Tax=Poecile atricapillus TaxID=48891 RepID=UPI002738301C|nr:protein TESPA1 [Poecile atricapillus]
MWGQGWHLGGREPDPEEILHSLGFVGSDPGVASRVPPRFFSAPSRASGIDLGLFLRAQLRRREMEEPGLALASRFQQLRALPATADASSRLCSRLSGTPPQRTGPPRPYRDIPDSPRGAPGARGVLAVTPRGGERGHPSGGPGGDPRSGGGSGRTRGAQEGPGGLRNDLGGSGMTPGVREGLGGLGNDLGGSGITWGGSGRAWGGSRMTWGAREGLGRLRKDSGVLRKDSGGLRKDPGGSGRAWGAQE